MAFVAGIYWPPLGRGGYQLVVLDGFLDSLCGGSADALVDDECLPQLRGGLAGVAVVQVGLAESFRGGGFLWGWANVGGGGRGLGGGFPGRRGGRGAGRPPAGAGGV